METPFYFGASLAFGFPARFCSSPEMWSVASARDINTNRASVV
jgi:hypothetical protein